MGVSAVPGSGKTFTLSYLAAALVERLIDQNRVDEQEVLIVTFTNPAVNSFRNRIGHLLQQERGLLPYAGYRVRTLHGLAHDIVRMRPGLVGLSENFEILDERITAAIIRELAESWLRTNSELLIGYVELAMAEDADQLVQMFRRNGADLVESIAHEVIRLGKDNQWTPEDMLVRLNRRKEDLPLARLGIELYADYQRALSYRSAVDFDDLVRLAMAALKEDADFLARLQERWPYILEDEAQDSSNLQNEMLRALSGGRNWVRVGDPNQAIYTTFTTADSNFLRQFLDEKGVKGQSLPVSGRSAPAIISLANELVLWSNRSSLVSHLAGALAVKPLIEPTSPGDLQPNPDNGLVYLDWDPEANITPERELERVVISLARWLQQDGQNKTVAVLAPENSRGFKVAEALKERDIPHEELLRSTSATRDAAGRLQLVFDFLADPTDSRRLARLYHSLWWPMAVGPPSEEAETIRNQVTRTLQRLSTPEDFLWPGPEGDWLDTLADAIDEPNRLLLQQFRAQTQFWLQASSLPVDQLILTVAQDLFTDAVDLALAHKIAVVMGSIAAHNPEYRLPDLCRELRAIAQNERRFLGFDDTTEGYAPQPGRVTVATMHAAKGLEWDRVYLMAVNNYSFPAALPGDSYIAEKWFIRDNLNLQAEAQAQVMALMSTKKNTPYREGDASRQARIDYAAERLRLLYVGITRAREDLIITWNMGRFWERGPELQNTASASLIALTDFWKENLQHD
jgi:DNA helicase-2/ATP-dependent DNA helicase PcrA